MAVERPFVEALIAPQIFVMSISAIPAGQYTARSANSTHAEVYNASSIYSSQYEFRPLAEKQQKDEYC